MEKLEHLVENLEKLAGGGGLEKSRVVKWLRGHGEEKLVTDKANFSMAKG